MQRDFFFWEKQKVIKKKVKCFMDFELNLEAGVFW